LSTINLTGHSRELCLVKDGKVFNPKRSIKSFLMTRFADPLKALYFDQLSIDYIDEILRQVGCAINYINDIPVIDIGSGNPLVIITGFSAYDYRIVNALTLMLYRYYSESIYHTPSVSESVLKKFRLHIILTANPDAYRVTDKYFHELSIMDKDSIIVFEDFLTLKSRYTQTIHKLIHEVKPEAAIILTYSDVDSVHITGLEVLESLMNEIAVGIKESNVNVKIKIEHLDPQLPHHHFTLESIPSVSICIPRSLSIVKIAQIITKVLSKLAQVDLKSLMEIKHQEAYKVVIYGNIDNIVSNFKEHNMEVKILSEREVEVTVRGLMRLIFRDRIVENYFKVYIP